MNLCEIWNALAVVNSWGSTYNFYMNPDEIYLFDVSKSSYADRLCAAALQGLINRSGPTLFLNYGVYDDPGARRTNEVFLDDKTWFGKFRDLLGNQDQHNLDYYRQAHGFRTQSISNLDDLVLKFQERLKGCVIWDAQMMDTANIALMLAAQEDLLVVEAGMRSWVEKFELTICHDLSGKWKERCELYEWAVNRFFAHCKKGFIACVEPGWERPEFVDYLVQERIFTYSLSSRSQGSGDKLLLLLAFGPAWLREVIYNLHLDGFFRRLGLALMGHRSSEVKLATRIQRAVQSTTYPTIFGWHTRRDDELAFMQHLSANGLRLVPAHLASNFSFHSRVNPLGMPEAVVIPELELDPEGTYITFTLSDGDQLMMMSTGELGNWYNSQRGSVPFNWETQPLLMEYAPALFEKYVRSATSNDCLIAGPSGAGYVIPPLAPDLSTYLQETKRVCKLAGIKVVTFYVADPPTRILNLLGKHSDGLTGYLAGYANLGRTPIVQKDSFVFAANQWPTLAHLWDDAGDLLEGVRKLAEAPGPRPRFIGVHLFAYRTTLADVIQFTASLNDPHIHIVRADNFLRVIQRSTKN